jgi:arsenate reductase
MSTKPTTVLFACIQNAGRSQMAAAFLNAIADPSLARGISAGSAPAAHVHPEVVEAMHEIGIDVSRATPQRLTDGLAATADVLVTMGCGEVCPLVPGLRRIDWQLRDPHGASPGAVREIRDDIRRRIELLVEHEGWGGDR